MFRLGEKFQGYSEIAILITNLPFIPFLYMAQSRHKEFSVFWLVSIFLVILQAATQGRQDFRFANITMFSSSYIGKIAAIFVSSCLQVLCHFIVVYSVLTATLPTVLSSSYWVYYTTSSTQSCLSSSSSSGCTCASGYIPKNDNSACRLAMSFSLDAAIEMIFAIGLLCLAWSLVSLRAHIGVYGEKMNERQDLITQIKVKNDFLQVELDKELSRATQQTQVEGGSFISPISKVIKIIRDIQVNSELDDETVDDLDYVVHLLLSNQLFKPQLMNSNMEAEVNQWLKQITESDHKEEAAILTTKATPGRKITKDSDSSGFQIE